MDFFYQLVRLSSAFYQNYPVQVYPELMGNSNRVYSCLLLELKSYYVCVPYRSNIKHPYAFIFKNTNRSQKSRSGLDFTKMVIATKEEYIDVTPSTLVDKDEFVQTVRNIKTIVHKAEKYLDDYIAIQKGTIAVDPEEYTRKYGASTLPYFHKELGL